MQIIFLYVIIYLAVYNCEWQNPRFKMYTVRIIKRYFTFGEDIRTLRLTSKLVDLRVGYAKRIQELRS